MTTQQQQSLPRWWQGIDADRRKYALGLLLIVTVAVIWVAASFVVQEVEAQGLHPFLLSYIANSLFIVYLPLHWVVSGTQKVLQERRCVLWPLSVTDPAGSQACVGPH